MVDRRAPRAQRDSKDAQDDAPAQTRAPRSDDGARVDREVTDSGLPRVGPGAREERAARKARVERLKELIAKGEYHPDAEEVACALLERGF